MLIKISLIPNDFKYWVSAREMTFKFLSTDFIVALRVKSFAHFSADWRRPFWAVERGTVGAESLFRKSGAIELIVFAEELRVKILLPEFFRISSLEPFSKTGRESKEIVLKFYSQNKKFDTWKFSGWFFIWLAFFYAQEELIQKD